MLDPGKKKSLVEWVNSLCVADCIESLKQLQNGVHFCKIVQLIDKDQQVEVDNPQDRYKIISSLLEGQYHVGLANKLDFDLIHNKADEFEIGKVCLLLLCVGVISENNALFLEPAMKLDTGSQHEIREMVESVLKPDLRLHELDSSFYRILVRPFDPTAALQQPQMSSTPHANAPSETNFSTYKTPTQPFIAAAVHGGSDTPLFSNSMQAGHAGGSSILGRFYSPAPPSPMSPVQQLVSSPGMTTKIKLQQKEQRIKRLLRDLNTERHLRSDLEIEIKGHEEELQKRECLLRELRAEVQTLRRELNDINVSGEQFRVDRDQEFLDSSRQRTQDLLKELREIRERNQHLEETNTDLFKETHQLREQLEKLEAFRRECGNYRSTLDHLENLVSELNVELREKQQHVDTLSSANEAMEQDLRRSQELYKEQRAELRRAVETSLQNESGECLQDVMEKQLAGQLELLQQTQERTEMERREWQRKAQQYQTEFDSLRKSSQERMSAFEGEIRMRDERLTSLEEALQARQNSIASLESEIHAREKHRIQYEESANTEIQNLRQQLDSTRHEFSVVQESSQSELKRLQYEIQQSTESQHSLSVQLENAGKKITSTESECNQYKELNEQIQSELAVLQKNLQARADQARALEVKLEESSNSNQQIISELQQERAKAEQSNAEICSLKRELSKASDAHEAICKEVETVKNVNFEIQSRLEKQVSELTESSNQLLQELDSVKESSQLEIGALQKHLQAKDDQVLSLEVKLEESSNSNQQIISELQQEKTLAEQSTVTICSLKRELSERSDAHEAICKGAEAVQNASLERQLGLEKQVSELTASSNQLYQELNSVKESSKLAQLSFEQELQRIQHSAEQEKTASADHLQSVIHEHTKLVEDLNNQLTAAKSEYATLSEQLQGVKQSTMLERSSLEQELATAKQRLTALDQELCDVKVKATEQESLLRTELEDITNKALKEQTNFEVKFSHLKSTSEQEQAALKQDIQILKESASKEETQALNEMHTCKEKSKNLEIELETFKSNSQAEKQALEHELSLLSQQKESLEQKIVRLESFVSELRDDLSSVREENSNLEKCLELHMSEKNALQEATDHLQKGILDIQKNTELETSRLQRDLAGKAQQSAELECLLLSERSERSDWQKKSEHLKIDLDSLQTSYKSEIESLKKAFEQECCEKKEAVNSLETLRNENFNYEQQMVEFNKKLEEQHQNNQMKIAELQSELDNISEEKSHLGSLVEKEELARTELQSRCSDLEVELSDLRQSSQNRISQFEQEFHSAQNKSSHLQTIVNNFQEKVELMETALLSSKETHEHTNQQLRDQVKAAEDRRNKLETSLSEYSKKYQVLSKDQETYFQKVMVMEEALRASKADATEKQQHLQVELSNACQQQQLLRADLETEKKKLGAASDLIEDVREESHRLKEDLKQEKEKNKKLTAELSLAEDTLRESEKMTTTLQETLNQTQSMSTRQQDHYTAELEASHCRETDLQTQLCQAESDLQDFRCKLEQLQQHVSKEIQSYRERERNLQTRLTEVQERSHQLEEKLSISRREVDMISESLQTTQNREAKLEDDVCREKEKAEQIMQQMRAELAEADNREQMLEAENNQMRTHLEEENRKIKESEAQLRIVQKTLEEVKSSSSLQNDDLKSELLSLQTVKHDLQIQLETSASDRGRLQSELLSCKEGYQKHAAELQSQLETAIKEKNTMESTLSGITSNADQQVGQMENCITELKTENSNLQAQLSSISDSKHHLETELNSRTEQILFMEKEINGITTKFSDKSTELITAIEQIKEYQAKIHDAEEQSVRFERALRLAEEATGLAQEDLKREIVSLQSHNEELSRHLEVTRTKAETEQKQTLENERELKDQLAQARSALRTLESQAKDLQNRFIHLESDKQAAKSEAHEKEKSLTIMVDELKQNNLLKEEELAAFKARVQMLEEKVNETGKHVHMLQEEHNSALSRTDSMVQELCKEKENHAKTRTYLQEELSQARQTKAETENKLEQMEAMHRMTVAQLEQQIHDLNRQRDSLQGKLHHSELKISGNAQTEERLHSMQLQLQEAHRTNTELQTQVNHLRHQHDLKFKDQQSQLNHANNIIAQMEKSSTQLREKCELLAEEKNDLRCRLQRMEDEYNSLRHQLAEQKAQIQNQAEHEVDKVHRKLNQLRQQSEERLQDVTDKHRLKLQQEMSDWQQKYESLTASYHKVKELLKQMEGDCRRHKDSAESYRSRCEHKSGQLTQLENELQLARQNNLDLERKYRENDVEVTALKTQIREQDTTLKKLYAQIRTLEAQLDLASRQLHNKGDWSKSLPVNARPPMSNSQATRQEQQSKNTRNKRRETTFDVHVKSELDDSMESNSGMSINDLRTGRSPSASSKGKKTHHPRSPSVPAKMEVDSQQLTSEKRSTSTFSLASSTGSGYVENCDQAPWAHPNFNMMTRSRASVIGLPGFGSQNQVHGKKLPREMGRMFVNEDEPEQCDEFGRLSELQRRNTLCLPHLKSAYPVEVQTRPLGQIADDKLRSGMFMEISEEQNISEPAEVKRGRKRLSAEGISHDQSLEGSVKSRRTLDSASTLDDSLESIIRDRRKAASGSDDSMDRGERRLTRRSSRTLNDSQESCGSRRKSSEENVYPLSTPGVKLYKHFSPLRSRVTRKSSSNCIADEPLGSYQKPGPPTPGVTPGASRATPRHGRTYRGHKASPSPVVSTKKIRRTSSRFTPTRKKPINENNVQGKNEPVGFNITFTPKQPRRLARLLGKKSQAGESQRKRPLAENNTLQKKRF